MAEQDKNERGGPLGGQELPPDQQDRPEQNKGYDEAVAGLRGRPGSMQVGTSGVTERRRELEERGDEPERGEGGPARRGAWLGAGAPAIKNDEGRGQPAPDKAEGER